MKRTYPYHGFEVEVGVEAGFHWQKGASMSSYGYIAIVRIVKTGATLAHFTPLRLGESGGHSFSTEGAAIMGGYSAGRRLVDDLLRAEST
ncbi:hypothetical protein AWB68_03351 [Caballeronia choica]|jgi:hypothetical protein|uniref:Uncharacterized protein n=1 Tax=Caballeronia choica TaxID=326476 RepID=A0A158J229_9BURK|nr:hypothetical protein [Caballeronia choica]SAL62992.1 hypothetical protein AWB68_03351 [Caballeronia choica]